MRIKSAIVVTLVLASSLALADKPSAKIDKIVREAVRESLKDPQSAQFDGLDTFVAGGMRTTCGYVNAKNSYGGYVGKSLFWTYGTDSAVAIVRLSSDDNREFLLSRCNKGLMLVEAAEEAAAKCPASATPNSPGECGQLMQQCTAEFGNIHSKAMQEHLKLCRQKGYAVAKAKYDSAMGQTFTWPAPPAVLVPSQ